MPVFSSTPFVVVVTNKEHEEAVFHKDELSNQMLISQKEQWRSHWIEASVKAINDIDTTQMKPFTSTISNE